jgi:hypothetical protein
MARVYVKDANGKFDKDTSKGRKKLFVKTKGGCPNRRCLG